jgi:hypothetical protein
MVGFIPLGGRPGPWPEVTSAMEEYQPIPWGFALEWLGMGPACFEGIINSRTKWS